MSTRRSDTRWKHSKVARYPLAMSCDKSDLVIADLMNCFAKRPGSARRSFRE